MCTSVPNVSVKEKEKKHYSDSWELDVVGSGERKLGRKEKAKFPFLNASLNSIIYF